mgnify:CR=1 FL=1
MHCVPTLRSSDPGAVYATGRNNYGQLGDGTTANKATPVGVMRAFTVTQVAAGQLHSFFKTNTGAVYATGYNEYGQLGDGTTTDKSAPVPVMSGYTVIQFLADYDPAVGIGEEMETRDEGRGAGRVLHWRLGYKSRQDSVPPLVT